MVCGRLARRIDSVMLLKGVFIRETPFTLPKPLAHLFYHLVSIVLKGVLEECVYTYIDLMSVCTRSESFRIPDRSNTV